MPHRRRPRDRDFSALRPDHTVEPCTADELVAKLEAMPAESPAASAYLDPVSSAMSTESDVTVEYADQAEFEHEVVEAIAHEGGHAS